VIRVTSLSKDMSVPGLKAGWLVGHPDFISEWYEYASTSMGGPPSVFYLLLEAAARFESWRLGGVEDPRDLVSEWSEYDVPPDLLAIAYGDYLRQRLRRERILGSHRDWIVGGLVELGYEVVPAGYSINVAASPPGAETSYGWWARTLDATSVSVYPGILSFCFDDRWVRLTSSIPAEALSKAISRLPYHPAADELL
jgi:aspartate/methionine/tyrosine aminotransferase